MHINFFSLFPSVCQSLGHLKFSFLPMLYLKVDCLLSLFFFKFIYPWLSWVPVAARGLSLVAASGGYSRLWCVGFSLRWLLPLWSTGSRHAGSVVVAHGL